MFQLVIAIKVAVLVSLVIVYGFFIQEVWVKFTEKSTSYIQSYKIVDSYTSPTVMFCFDPPEKPSMKKHYNIDGMPYNTLITSNHTTKSMTKLFQDTYYQHGRDFILTATNYKFEVIELHEGSENIIEMSNGIMNKIVVKKFYSYVMGSCYSATQLLFQDPDEFFNFGLIFNDSLKLKKDEPKKVEVIITSKTNAYGIIRGSYVEGEQLNMYLSMKDRGSVVANLREYRYNLLSSPPHCVQIDHYKCLGNGLQKVLEDEKSCISSKYGNFCINNCPKICLPLAFQNFLELVSSNVTIPICETGEENNCMATNMAIYLEVLSRDCSTSCNIIKYKGAESDEKVIFYNSNNFLCQFNVLWLKTI